MTPGSRLLAAASLVRDGSRIADIGTDHAYLPIFLVESGRVISAIASDVREGPIDNARVNVARYNLSDKIDVRLGDGLRCISADEVDDIIICGMGGELISWILDDAKWVRSSDKRLILQPMTAVDDLRIWLADNGFAILEELLAKDGGRIYTVFSAKYVGNKQNYTDEYPYIGTVTPDMEYGKEYLSIQLNRVQKHADMLLNSKHGIERERLCKIADMIRERIGGVA